MTSRSYINTIASIAITEAQINTLTEQLPDDELEKIVGSLADAKAACNEAYLSWPGEIDKKGMKRLNGILDRFQSSLKSLELAEFTSLTLAVLESLRAKLVTSGAARHRINAITKIIETFYEVHSHFDESGDKMEQYTKADGIGRRWNELMEA